MLERLLKLYGVYGDEEESYDCKDIFKNILMNLEDDEADIQLILRYLIEKTDFLSWVDENYHSIPEDENSNECCDDCENCEYCNTEEDIQTEILKNTQEELKALKKKYNKLLRKYKGLSN